jgi:hypothetical protein
LEKIQAEAQKYPTIVIHEYSIPVKKKMEQLVDWMDSYKEPGYDGEDQIIDIHRLLEYAQSLRLPAGWTRGVVGWFLERGLLKRSDIHLWLVEWNKGQEEIAE